MRAPRISGETIGPERGQAIHAKEMSIAIVHQAAGDHSKSFSRQSGIDDAPHARSYGATVIGQPSGSATYYFQAVKEIFEKPSGPSYGPGRYGGTRNSLNAHQKG